MTHLSLFEKRERSPYIQNPADLLPGQSAAFITLSTLHGRCYMNDSRIASFVDRAVRKTFPILGIPVYAYCVMPDHLHLLIGNVTSIDLPTITFNFIRLTGEQTIRRFHTKLWQWHHYKQLLDEDSALNVLVDNILSNPVRNGIVKENESYPYRGSTICIN